MTMQSIWLTTFLPLLVAPLLGYQDGVRDPGSPAGRPNVLLIISDDQAWTDFGFMGHEALETPRLDRLAAESLTFTRGYVAAPLCRPSLASILLGLHPHQHGITGNDPRLPAELPPGSSSRTRPELASLYETLMHRIEEHPGVASLLVHEGYLALQTGKWWEGSYRRGGFTHGMTHGDPQRGGRHGDEGLAISRQGLGPIPAFLDEVREREKPFFIWHAPFLPHTPHDPPARLLEKYAARTESEHVARYWAMCEWFDETCGELLDLIDERGLRDDTLVLFVTDNGWIQRADAEGFAARSKRSPYEGGVRTPILLRWPGRLAPRRDDATLVSSVDLAPTILRACGVEPPSSMTGLDLLDPGALRERDAVFGAAYQHDVLDVDDFTASLEARFVVHGDWKLLVQRGEDRPAGRVELYNLRDDPFETAELAAQEPARVATLSKLMDGWWPGRMDK